MKILVHDSVRIILISVVLLFSSVPDVRVFVHSPDLEYTRYAPTVQYRHISRARIELDKSRVAKSPIYRSYGRFTRMTGHPFVEAGSTPIKVDVSSLENGLEFEPYLPGLTKLDAEDQEVAKHFSHDIGYGVPLNQYFPGQNVNFLRNRCLAFVVDDLHSAGYDVKSDKGILRGLLETFHIVIDVPGQHPRFPNKAVLHLEYHDFDAKKRLDVKIDMIAHQNGDYYFSDFEDVVRVFAELDTLLGDRKSHHRNKRELRFVRMVDFDMQSMIIPSLPDIDGVTLTHKIYFGGWLAISGWQWFDRPFTRDGLGFPGFVDSEES